NKIICVSLFMSEDIYFVTNETAMILAFSCKCSLKISMVFQVAETLLAAEEAKDVRGEKERMLMVRGSKALLEGNSYLHLYVTVFSPL
ncbi:unnamed protein product, partial [Bubo scandiacus]